MQTKEDRERILTDLGASELAEATFSRLPDNPGGQRLRERRRQVEVGKLDVPGCRVRGRCERGRHDRYPEAAKREALRLRARDMGWAGVARRLGVSSGDGVAFLAKAAERAKTGSGEEVLVDARKDVRGFARDRGRAGERGFARADARPKSRRPGEPLQ